MIYEFNCPICKQKHGSLIIPDIFQKGVTIVCPVTHRNFRLALKPEFDVPPSFERGEMLMAEKAAAEEDRTWMTQEYLTERKNIER